MAKKHKKRLSEEYPELGLQIAPMINVIIVIISVFVATSASGLVESELGVKVPGSGAPSNPTNVQQPVNITINKAGAVQFNNTTVDSPDVRDLPQLTERLRNIIAHFDDQPVIIRPDADTPHERVIDVLNACSAAGVKNLSFGGG